VAASIDHDAWVAAYIRELDHYAVLTPGRRVTSVFFGGGTPSLMKPQTVSAVITHIQKKWHLGDDAEITLEANPTSIEAATFQDFKSAGVTRVSVGVQSLRDDVLKFLGRAHDAVQARAALDIARRTFDRFSFDLIYARPDQTLDEWRGELGEALTLAGGHLSLYQLTIEPGTAFFTIHERGEFVMPENDRAADLYELTQDMMTSAGLPAYEISNHAAPGQESRHNLTYWRYGDYVGVGPGAHGRLTVAGEKVATRAHRAPEVWMKRVMETGQGAHPVEPISADAQFAEALMMGLRLTEGIEGTLSSRLNAGKVDTLIREGMLVTLDGRVMATPKGRACLNSVLAYLI